MDEVSGAVAVEIRETIRTRDSEELGAGGRVAEGSDWKRTKSISLPVEVERKRRTDRRREVAEPVQRQSVTEQRNEKQTDVRTPERPQNLPKRELLLEVSRTGGRVEAETALDDGLLSGSEEARGRGRGGEEEEHGDSGEDGEAACEHESVSLRGRRGDGRGTAYPRGRRSIYRGGTG